MKLKHFSLIPLFFLFLFSYMPTAIGEEAPHQDPQVYTNEDIKKYRAPSETATYGTPASSPAEKAERSQRMKGEHDKEHWCKKAAPYHRKIEKTKDAIREAEKDQSAAKEKGFIRNKTERSLSTKISKLRNRLREAERELGTIEDEAHRKGIPPGWLRCQFE